MSERVDQNKRDNTNKALRELFRLYHNSNYVSRRISEEKTKIEGYTKHSFSELEDIINVIRSRYGYYCNISFKYDPCQMFLAIDVEERKIM